MERKLGWLCAGSLALACALPKVDVDPSLAPGAGTGGTSGTTSSGGTGGTSAAPGSGGTSSGTGGQGGSDDREFECGDYCDTYLQNCANSPANTYTGLDDCLNTCFTSDWPLGSDITQPNSIQCRDLHAHLARDLPDPHCFHSAKVPSGTSCALSAGGSPP
jgi:hypothetical protein